MAEIFSTVSSIFLGNDILGNDIFETNFRDQLLFIDGATLFRNPAEEMNKVQDFLNIGRELKTKNFVKE